MHNLFNQTFFSYRQPAWHGLGVTVEDEHSAEDAFRMAGMYDIHLEPLVTESGVTTPYRAIVRDATPGDPSPRVFGVVGSDYQLIPPLEVCRAMGSTPVETLGALGRGETFFISVRRPTFQVGNDEIEDYLLVLSPYDGFSSLKVIQTPVRVVCQNTLMSGIREAQWTLKIPHLGQLQESLEFVLQQATSSVLPEMFNQLHQKEISLSEFLEFLKFVYPDPPQPTPTWKGVSSNQEAEYAYRLGLARRSREAVQALFEGAGTAIDTSAWGAWNAVVEWENYRPSRNLDSRGRAVLLGDRAQVMSRSFSYLLRL